MKFLEHQTSFKSCRTRLQQFLARNLNIFRTIHYYLTLYSGHLSKFLFFLAQKPILGKNYGMPLRQVTLFLRPGFQNSCKNLRFFATEQKLPLVVERLQQDDSGIVLLRMNRPETKNAFSRVMVDLFRKSIDELKFDKQVRAVIIKSDVPGAFCTGNFIFYFK